MVSVAAGYIKGGPISLAVLDYGRFQVHANGRIIAIVGFVIRTDSDEVILVDTGFPAKYAQDPDLASAEDGLGSFGKVLTLTPQNLPPAQLALLGLSPTEIDLLILTHSHIDHVGGLAGFPQAPILLSQAELALPAPLYFATTRAMVWPDRTYIPVTADCDLGPGLRLLAVPGHVAGQLALWVDLPATGPVLLVSDAISRPAEITERFDTADDPQAAIASAERLLDLAARTGAMVIYGHCPAQWPGLKKAPDLYR